MIGEEPFLNIDFLQRKPEAEYGFVLKPQNTLAMSLRKIPYSVSSSHDDGSKLLGDDVEEEVDSPVEHFHEEGEFSQYPGVDVVGEPGRVRRVNSGKTAARARLRGVSIRGVGRVIIE